MLLSLILVGIQMGSGCPGNQTVTPCSEDTLTFNGGSLVTLDGTRSTDPDGSRLDYQWTQLTGTPVTLSGAQTVITTFTAPTTNETLTFQLTVTDPTALSDSCVATVTIQCPATTITPQPVDRRICAGDTATFTVAATGLGTLTFQWQKNGANLVDGGHYSGATTATLTVTGADGSDAANYACVVTGRCDAVTSSTAALSLRDATSITQQPVAQRLCEGSNVTFAVTATGDGTLSFQWQRNGANLTNGGRISGADTASLTVVGLAISDAGDYRCVVTGGCGVATSNTATLTVDPATRITTQPTDQSIAFGASATFTVAASGSGTLTYQWQFNGLNIADGVQYSGTTTPTLAISSATPGSVAGAYRCVVTGGCGTVTSNPATLAVAPGPPTSGPG